MTNTSIQSATTSAINVAQQQVRQLQSEKQELVSEKQELVQRVKEADVLYTLSTLLSAHRNVDELLNSAAELAVKVMHAKAASIRLLSDDGTELIPKATCNLSEGYLKNKPIRVENSELARRAFEGDVTYIPDISQDTRTLYPSDVKREGLVSMLSAPMVYKDQTLGTLRVYSGEPRAFSPSSGELLKAVGHLMAAAIDHARVDARESERRHVKRQLQMGAAVQRRMLPATMPQMPPFDIAARYEASLDLGGDFFDFIDLEGHLGVVVADVVGKGVAASLLMSAVRASLRAYAQDVYDLDEVISRVNYAMSRDTLVNEFATLFYGVLDPQTCQLTYCNAGHEPPLLLRDGKIQMLETGGMIIGVDDQEVYDKQNVKLQANDYLLFYTDGLTEAFDFNDKQFGRERINNALKEAAEARMDAQTTLKHIHWQLRRFTGLRDLMDDLTIVVIRVTDEQAALALPTNNKTQYKNEIES